MAISPRLCLLPILDQNGVPIAGSKVYIYAAGTTTPLSLYTDYTLSTAADNPIVATQGFVPLRFMATASYKIVVTTSAGASVTGYDGDNIDPGVAVGSGALPVASGGTGASTAAGARTNLAAAAATDMATAQSDIANLQTWAGYNLTSRSRMAAGTTAQQPSAANAGAYRFDSDLVLPLVDNGSAWKKIGIEGKLDSTYFASAAGRWQLQRYRTTTLSNTSTASAIPYDTSAPQITEGVQLFSTTFTPLSASSVIRVTAQVQCESNTADTLQSLALHKNGGTSAIATASAGVSVVSGTAMPYLIYEESPGSVSPITYRINGGGSGGSTAFNGSSATLGGTRVSFMEIEEWLQL